MPKSHMQHQREQDCPPGVDEDLHFLFGCQFDEDERMKMTAAEYQRSLDQAAELELDMERIEQDMREILLAGDEFPLTYRNQSGIRCHATYDRDDVINAMIELDADTHNRAVMMTRTDPIEAAKILTHLMVRAVEQIIGLAPIREAAEFTEMENAA